MSHEEGREALCKIGDSDTEPSPNLIVLSPRRTGRVILEIGCGSCPSPRTRQDLGSQRQTKPQMPKTSAGIRKSQKLPTAIELRAKSFSSFFFCKNQFSGLPLREVGLCLADRTRDGEKGPNYNSYLGQRGLLLPPLHPYPPRIYLLQIVSKDHFFSDKRDP